MRRLIRVCAVFANINTLLVMVDCKMTVYDQALIHFALIGDKASMGLHKFCQNWIFNSPSEL